MKLTFLGCNGTRVTDWTPIREMPLNTLWLDFDSKRDTEIVRSIKTLETINGKEAKEVLK